MSKSTKDTHFFRELLPFRGIKILNCLVDQGHIVQIFSLTPFDSKRQNLQETPTHLCSSTYRFRYIIFNIYLQNVGHGHAVQIPQSTIRWQMLTSAMTSTHIWASSVRIREVSDS